METTIEQIRGDASYSSSPTDYQGLNETIEIFGQNWQIEQILMIVFAGWVVFEVFHET